MSKVEIQTNGVRAKILIDGKEIENVRGYKLSQSVEKIPILTLEIVPKELCVEGEDITCINDEWKKYKTKEN